MKTVLLFLLAAAALFFGLVRQKASSQEPSLEDLEALLPRAVTWVQQQRDHFRPRGRPLNETERRAFEPFFPQEILEEARIATTDRITNPEFVEDLGTGPDGGLLYDMRGASGIAFIDTVAVVDSRTEPGSRRWMGLIFHELVHLTQYRELGIEGFVESYVRSMAEVEFHYPSIDHESQAFELQRRFARGPEAVFSVQDEVRKKFVGTRETP